MESLNQNPEIRNSSEVEMKAQVVHRQMSYFLNETKYRIIKSRGTDWADWAVRTLFLFFGAIVILIAKIIQKIVNNSPFNLDNIFIKYEVWTCIILLFAWVIIKIIDFYSKGERKQIISEIDEHFKSNPATPNIDIFDK